jgi:hypothetical protein
MTSTSPPDQTVETKPSVEKIDKISVAEEPEKPLNNVGLDKFGAAEKSDPAEIALVKKIDRYMLPILWLMYCKHIARFVLRKHWLTLLLFKFSISLIGMPLSTARLMAWTRISVWWGLSTIPLSAFSSSGKICLPCLREELLTIVCP